MDNPLKYHHKVHSKTWMVIHFDDDISNIDIKPIRNVRGVECVVNHLRYSLTIAMGLFFSPTETAHEIATEIEKQLKNE